MGYFPNTERLKNAKPEPGLPDYNEGIFVKVGG